MADKLWLGTTDTTYHTPANWSPSGAPTASDHVRLSPLYNNAVAGGNNSGEAIGDFIVENGFAQTIGDKSTNLKIDPDYFSFDSSGQAFIDLHSAAITAEIRNTASAGTGEHGLNLICSALTELSVVSGDVGVAAVHNTSATVVTANVSGGDLTCGEGTTLTTLNIYTGNATIRCNVTNLNVYGGSVYLEEQAAVTTLNLKGRGVVYYNATGTMTTANIDQGILNCTQVGLARTISTLKINEGSIVYDPNRVTVTARSEPDNPVSDTISSAY